MNIENCPQCKGTNIIQNPDLTKWITDGKDKYEFITKIGPPFVLCPNCKGAGRVKKENENE